MRTKRLVIDVLLPREPSVVDYAERISDLEGIEGLAIEVLGVDDETKTVQVMIEGKRPAVRRGQAINGGTWRLRSLD